MYGWLVVNQYFTSPKFDELFTMLEKAAVLYDIELERVGNARILADVQTGQVLSPPRRPDFVLFWDKDIRLAQSLEAVGLKLFNSAEAIRLCDDKSLTFMALQKAGILQPKSFIAPFAFSRSPRNEADFFLSAAEKLGYPAVVKECRGSFGTGVSLVENQWQMRRLVEKLGSAPCMVQQYISTSCGRDVRVSVVGGKAVAAMLRVGKHGDFRSNLTIGGHFEQIEPNEKMLQTAEKACVALGLDFAGVDVLFGKDGEPIICEVNSNAHFKTTLDCTGINMAEKIMEHITEVMSK